MLVMLTLPILIKEIDIKRKINYDFYGSALALHDVIESVSSKESSVMEGM